MVSEEQNSDIELASEVIPVPQVHQPEVEAPVPKDTDETNEKANDIPPGKYRQRKRALHAAILKQMEFYFSDSNLSKDRFLAGLVTECPGKFNVYKHVLENSQNTDHPLLSFQMYL